MTITGLSQNGYLINNPILIKISTNQNLRYLDLSLVNLENTLNNANLRYYANQNGEVEVDISVIIKSLFTKPSFSLGNPFQDNLVPNSNNFILTFTAQNIEGVEVETIQKTFIRGGYYNDKTNNSLPSNKAMLITNQLPFWSGYPFRYYKTDTNFKVIEKPSNGGMINDGVTVEYLREKSCNGKYLAFLNSLGGYSFWLFDNYTEEATNEHLGIVNNAFSRKDLGNEYNNSFRVFGKIPERFYIILKDLITSPEIYEYNKETLSWKRIYSASGNKWIDNGQSVAFKVDFRFNDFTNYKPSL